jgi:hypothetical protein
MAQRAKPFLVIPGRCRAPSRCDATVPADLNRNRHQIPHMLVRDGESAFASVRMFFEKRDIG